MPENPLDIANAALTDAFILKVRRWKQHRGSLTLEDVMALLAHMYEVPDDPDEWAGPLICMAAELLLRLVNTEPPQLDV